MNTDKTMVNHPLAESTTEVQPPGLSPTADDQLLEVTDDNGVLSPTDNVVQDVRRGLGKAIALIHLTSQIWLELEDILYSDSYGKQVLLAVGHYADQLLRIIREGHYPLGDVKPPLASMMGIIFSCPDLTLIFTPPQLVALSQWVNDSTWNYYYGTPTGMSDYLFGLYPDRIYANEAFLNASVYQAAMKEFDMQTFAHLALYHPEGRCLGIAAGKFLVEKIKSVQPAKDHTLSSYTFPARRETRQQIKRDIRLTSTSHSILFD